MSNRSLAAARSRRSPQEIVNEQAFKKPPQQMPPQNHPQQNHPAQQQQNSLPADNKGMPQPGSKLSISDAIGLITIRLSKVESHIMKEQSEENTNKPSNNGSSSDVETIMRSVISRLTALERTQDTANKNVDKIQLSIKDLQENPSQPIQPVSTGPDPFLLELVEKNEKEISELKQLVIRLQTMFIETTMNVQQLQQRIPVVDYSAVPETVVDSNSSGSGSGSVTVSI